MNAPVLGWAARGIAPVLGLFSLFLLLRGHDHPGGGFSGGAVMAAAVTLHLVAGDREGARRMLRVHPVRLLGVGVLLKVVSGSFALLDGEPFLTDRWMTLPLPAGRALELGTPLLFEAGTYLVVLGAVSAVVLWLTEDY